MINSVECIQVRLAGIDELWLAMPYHYLIHRRVVRYSSNGPLRQITEINKYKDMGNGICSRSESRLTTILRRWAIEREQDQDGAGIGACLVSIRECR